LQVYSAQTPSFALKKVRKANGNEAAQVANYPLDVV